MHTLNADNYVGTTALLNDQLFVSHNSAQRVSVCNTTSFQLQRQLIIPGLGSRVSGPAACATNNVLYVSDYFNQVIHKVDLFITSGDSVVSRWGVASGPYGLSVNRAHNVIVALFRKVQEYTPSGSLVREIHDSNNYLWQAIELNSVMLAVIRRHPAHGVAMMSMDGRVIRSLGNEAGSGVGQMNNPCGIAVDNDGYIFVADNTNNRILVVNPSLTDSRQLPLPVNTSLNRPRAVSLDQSRGRLYVGEDHDQQRVLIFDNVINIRAMFIT